MKPDSKSVPSGEILRADTAVALVLVAVLVLALVAVLAGLRAARNQSRAEQAEAAGRERLWSAYLTTARAMRESGEAGRRETALGVISNAAIFRPSAALRTEAIASLVLSDLTQEGPLLPTPSDFLARSMDGFLQHYAYGDSHGKIFVGDLVTRQPLFELQASELGATTQMSVRNVVFSPDGKSLAARFTGGAVVVWDLETKRILMAADTNSAQYQLSSVAFSPDSSKVIFPDPEAQGQIMVYEIGTGQKITAGVQAGFNFFRVRADGKKVAIVAEGGVALMDFPSGTNRQLLPHTTPANLLAWSPDGHRLATSCEDGDIYIWDFVNQTHRLFRGHTERCVNLGFSPDGAELFSSSRDGTTRLWDVAQGQMIAIGEGIAESFTPDGKRLGFWRTFTGFGVWSVSQSADYRLLSCAKSEGPLFTLDLSPSGQWCVATQNKGFRVWNLNDNERESYVELPGVYCARVAPDEQSLFIGRSAGLETWPLTNLVNGELQLTPANAKVIPLPDSLGARGVAVSLDGNSAAVELTDRRLIVLDLASNREPTVLKGRWRNVNFKGPASPTGAGRFAISPDGRWVVTGFEFGGNDVPRVWDARSGELVTTLKAGTSVVTFSPDGRWLGLAGVANYSIWSVGDWHLLSSFDRDEPSITHGAMAFTRENGLLAVASTRKNIQLFPMTATTTGQKLFDLIGPSPQSVNSIRFALDGSVLVTATASDLVQVWRLNRLQRELVPLRLDWGAPVQPDAAVNAAPGHGPRMDGLRATLGFSLAGVLLTGVFAVVILRQYRAGIERFISAEAKTAQRNRELEITKIELMHSQKMRALGTLAAGIAHDFNNLLSVIRMSNKLVGRVTKDAEIQEHVTDIEQAAVQGKNVIRSMLGYARKETFPAEPASVNQVIESTVSLLNHEFLSGIQLVLELAPETRPVTINQGRLEQVLLNLIVNASEAMQGRGTLKITTRLQPADAPSPAVLCPRPSSGYVEMRVGDSGPGIAPEILGRIFEPFFSTKLTASTPGTGLGLSLVYSIAQQDGLGLNVESPPGAGATFSVLIPVTTA